MDLINIITDLVKFRTETGNTPEVLQCFEYCKILFAKTNAKVDIFQKDGVAPVLFVRNTDSEEFDVLCLGHLDVVPASDEMFMPEIRDGRMYGRGTLDMKSFAAVAFNSMFHVLENNLPLKFGIILSSDEEKGSKGTEAFLEAHKDMKAEIVLDNDVGGNILSIVNKCKNPVFVKLIAEGKEAHGSTPWDGIDANEKLMHVWCNIRKIYPYFSKEHKMPEDTWIDTVHFAKIEGGQVSNVISNYAEALLDFRLTEDSTVENLEQNLKKCMEDGVTYKIVSSSTPVVMDQNNKYIQSYKKLAEEVLGQPMFFEQIGGATDSRAFAVRGSTVIMNSGTGEGMHAAGEYVEIDSVKKLADIQIKFLDKLAEEK